MRKLLGRTVSIFGFSVPIYMFILVAAVAAWGGTILIAGVARATISVAASPIRSPDIVWTTHNCVINPEGGTVVTTWDESTTTLVCDFDEFSDVSRGSMQLNFTNNETTNSVSVTTSIPADTACAAFEWALEPLAVVPPGDPAQGAYLRVNGVAGPAGTITCAGDNLPSVEMTVNVGLIE